MRVVVGSAIVSHRSREHLQASKDNLVASVLELCRSLAASTHAARQGDKVRRMNWITNIVRPGLKKLMGGKDRGGDTPENLWKQMSQPAAR